MINKAKYPHLLQIYYAALAAVNGRTCVANALTSFPNTQVALLAVGKAAWNMAAGAFDVLETRIERTLIITKYGHAFPHLLPRAVPLQALESGHPNPDLASFEAGLCVVEFLHQLPSGMPLLVLWSGGASALLELPAPGISFDDVLRANTWLLGSGLDIHAMNAVRKALSALKGGRLAAHTAGRAVRVLLISDVPGDDWRSIGSAPFAWHESLLLPPSLPTWLQDLTGHALPLTDPDAFTRIQHEIIASSSQALRAAAQQAARLGYPVHAGRLSGDALDSGRILAHYLQAAESGSIYVWGGETVVRLPPTPGRGGRCQSLALAAALELQSTEGIALLAAGSDGSDGAGSDAGALIDSGTIARGTAAGRNAQNDLACADAGSFLAASGDLLQTGPTGTNVMDICVGYKQ